MDLTNYVVAFKTTVMTLADVPHIHVLEKPDNQYLILCPCGKHYWFDVDKNTDKSQIRCPFCQSNDHSHFRTHSGDHFNAGTF